MSSKVHFQSLFRRPQMILVLVALSVWTLTSVRAQDATGADIQPDAGTWATWVLESGSQFRLGEPPDKAATEDEIAQLKALVANRDEVALRQIAYWNSGPASYRWNQIALDEIVRRGWPANTAYRGLALLHAAIYDATVAAWDSKYAHHRVRPSVVDPSLETVIANPASPSYPSEHAVTAGAASTVLAWLFPDMEEAFLEKAEAAGQSRLLAGVEYPSDVEAGLALGRQVANLVIARGDADGSKAEWAGSIPDDVGHWSGENPVFPTMSRWTAWVLTSPDQFRPPAPPAYDSEALANEMEELRTYERTPVSSALAMFWEYGAGGRRIHWYWNDVASREILAAGWAGDAPMAARAYALANIAMYDATVACWDAKYTYWAMRPFQLDPEFKPVFTTPNHPSYPSAHSCISTAAATMLADLFPTDAEDLLRMAHEASESRIWGGIHFRSDIVAGERLGRNVANAVIAHAAAGAAQ